MKKNFLLFLFFSGFLLSNAQNRFGKWSDLFSYNNVLALEESNGKIIAGTENGVFYYDTVSGEITKLSKVNGLHEVKISAFDYNPDTKIGLIGYKSGNLDVITPEGVTYIVDIPLSQSFTGSKNINHISITGDQAVISVGYGVSIFNLSKKEFGDTCFFNNISSFESVKEASIKDNVIYAITDAGIRYHALDVTFSVFSTWHTYPSFFKHIDAKSILVFTNQNNVFFGSIASFSTLSQNFTNIKDVKITDQNIIVNDFDKVYVYNLSGVLQKTVDIGEETNSATLVNSQIYTGTKLSGILDENKISYKPDGPYSNASFRITLLNNQIWVASGGLVDYTSPNYSLVGYYHFDGQKWIYPEYFKNSNFSWNITDVKPNPAKPSEVFFTNFSFYQGEKGIYKMENDQLKKIYLQNVGSNYLNRTIGITYDEDNNLFCSLGFIDITNAPSAGFLYYNPTLDDFVTVPVASTFRVQYPIAKDGILWMSSYLYNGGGLIGYNYKKTLQNLSDDNFKVINKTNNLIADGVITMAIDKNNDAWIGQLEGLRVLQNVNNSLTGNPKAEPIVIEQNGVPEELFKDSKVIQITVDSGNQKWVSIDGGGVYFLSANGEKTINHFTKVNSPLPNNTVTDIEIDEKTGKIYFVTYDGIVVYQGDVINVTENFGNVKVYPNPVITSQFNGNVRITGLAQKTNIRITDSTGNLVHQAIARGGFYEWNLNNQKGTRIASGIYYVLMTNEDGTDKATAKIAVVN